jgi:RiboL-PSP-HEPN
MPSLALQSFQANRKDADALVAMHATLSIPPGTGTDLQPLNKAVVVFVCAAWESYCEDLVDEAIGHIVADCSDHTKLPEKLRLHIAKKAKDDLNHLSPWDLAGDGWTKLIQSNASAFVKDWTGSWHTPKPDPVDALFLGCLGVPKISNSWEWPGCKSYDAREKLKQFVKLRGDIAHRLTANAATLKQDGLDFSLHVDQLAAITDKEIGNHLVTVTGKTYW